MFNQTAINASDRVNWLLQESQQLLSDQKHDQAVLVAIQVLRIHGISVLQRRAILEMLSVNAYYCKDKTLRQVGYWAAEELTMDKTLPWPARCLAKQNQSWYINPLGDLIDITSTQVEFEPEPGYRAFNPSIAKIGDDLLMIQRTSNFQITADGYYHAPGFPYINTINYLCWLDHDLRIARRQEIVLPDDWPTPVWSGSNGFEDMRLIVRGSELWFTSSMRELNPEGVNEIVMGRLRPNITSDTCTFDQWKKIIPTHQHQHEKNWVPMQNTDPLRIIYNAWPNTVINDVGEPLSIHEPPLLLDWFRGGSQAIRWEDDWLTVIHESVIMGNNTRRYLHRFVRWSDAGTIISFTPAFNIHHLGIEFVAGMCLHPVTNQLILSMGLLDSSSWLITIDPNEMLKMMIPIDKYLQYCQERMTKLS